MKLLIYGMTEDEKKTLVEIRQQVDVEEIAFADGIFTKDRIAEVDGFRAIWIMTNSMIGEEEARLLSEHGVRYIVSRATGIDHLDLEALRKYGIKAANVPSYSPNAISEHTLMLLLNALRHMRRSEAMVARRDFGIAGLCGREIRTMTIGVIGAGRIGTLTIKALAALGAKVLVHARHVHLDLVGIATQVSLSEIWERSDAIVLHCPLTKENTHLIGKETLEQCKPGVVVVNTARGGLVDGKAMLDALKKGKVSAFAMDVYETEDDFVRIDFEGKPTGDPVFEELLAREEVIYTSHISFLTDRALYEIMRISLENASEYEKNGICHNEVTTGKGQ